MFDNKIDPIESQNQITLSHHLFSDISWFKMEKHLKLICIAWVICGAYLVLHQVVKRYQKMMSSISVSF